MDTQPDPQDVPSEIDYTEVDQPSRLDMAQPFSWQAPEGAQVARGIGWYVGFGVIVLGLMLLAVLVFKSVTFAILLAVMVVAVILLGTKAPRVINYGISPKGIYVSDKLYDYSEFRAFGVIQDPGYLSITVLPVKRFSAGLTLYFDEKDGERIVDLLGARLPIQEVKPDSIEKLIRLIKL